MARLQRLLNVLAWGLSVAIAWTEWRNPARPSAAAEGDGGSSEGTSAGPAPANAPAPPPDTAAPTEATSGTSGGVVPLGSAPPTPPAPVAEVEPAPAGTEDAGEIVPDAAPTAAEPLFADAPPGAPIVGTAAPIPAPREGGRPVPAGAVPGDDTATCPPEYPIKGNASSMIYHRPGQPSYERTVAEFCFASEADAEGAGYRPPRR